MKITDTFARLLEESVVIRGVITILLVGTTCALFVLEALGYAKAPPDALLYLTTGAVAFYFGAMLSRKASSPAGQ